MNAFNVYTEHSSKDWNIDQITSCCEIRKNVTLIIDSWSVSVYVCIDFTSAVTHCVWASSLGGVYYFILHSQIKVNHQRRHLSLTYLFYLKLIHYIRRFCGVPHIICMTDMDRAKQSKNYIKKIEKKKTRLQALFSEEAILKISHIPTTVSKNISINHCIIKWLRCVFVSDYR